MQQDNNNFKDISTAKKVYTQHLCNLDYLMIFAAPNATLVYNIRTYM